MREKRKIGVSNFGVFAQIWSIGPNFNLQSSSVFNVDREELFTCSDCFGSFRFIPVKQPILESFGVVTGVWLNL